MSVIVKKINYPLAAHFSAATPTPHTCVSESVQLKDPVEHTAHHVGPPYQGNNSVLALWRVKMRTETQARQSRFKFQLCDLGQII